MAELSRNHAAEFEDQLDRISSIQDFCRDWKTKWRGIAVAAQAALTLLFPAGAKVLGILISIADTTCGVGGGS